MNNVHFPVQVVALFRRLFNVMTTFSLSGQYLISKARAEDSDTSNNTPGEVNTTSNDFWWNPLSPNKWDWLRVGLLVDNVLEQPTKHPTPTLPRWTSEGKLFRLTFTSVHQTHVLVHKQADASLRTIKNRGL
jgi:triacylglycerol lipase